MGGGSREGTKDRAGRTLVRRRLGIILYAVKMSYNWSKGEECGHVVGLAISVTKQYVC